MAEMRVSEQQTFMCSTYDDGGLGLITRPYLRTTRQDIGDTW